jgi:hypothetical protein
MTSILHTKAQGLRVHKLANLGGLVAIAGLEDIDSSLLLGALMELAKQLPSISLSHKELLQKEGVQKLRDRNSEKRIYKQRQKTEDSNTEITFHIEDIQKLIIKLGGKIPVFEKNFIPELLRLMR